MEDDADSHVLARASLLNGETVWPAPAHPARSCQAADLPDGIAETVLADLARDGLAVLSLDEPAPVDRFRALGELLGTPMPELAPAVLPYVEQGVVLNLLADQGHTPDADLAPFAKNFLSLHSEGSGRAVGQQPRHIVLMCVDPGDGAAQAQTVLVPMAAVARRLTAAEIDLLTHTSYRHLAETGPTIARHVDGRVVFSFRDFMDDKLDWTCSAPGPDDGADVTAALRSLLAAMYTAADMAGVHWTRGQIVVIENTFFFHGRTAGSTATGERNRHLRRVRVV
ncbi:hypothetical protein [Alloactinosynnema sp. L-07]|uniref:TauD/TfdA family dioxygenase n=1 Tax=Alloactinosynnema sp. L-07 TaxID=1653480 RepID=UPI00065F0376|nr:TauD/TfdA family dioxygenase [Alloactinosynnema sp. L-07]CRK61877.1 hypothetical protein [Alloactinosynnema sp. L-07]